MQHTHLAKNLHLPCLTKSNSYKPIPVLKIEEDLKMILDERECTQNKTTKAHKKMHNTSVTRETLTEATVAHCLSGCL